MTVWSATPYCGEEDVLEIRLGTLAEVVDRHLIVEADTTQHGQAKPFYFEQQRERFRPWLEKITYLKANLNRDLGFDWERERNLRDLLQQQLRQAADDDLVLLSDVDEIPRPELVRDYGQTHRLELDMHLYYLNWRWPEKPVRSASRATLCSALTVKSVLPSRIVEPDWPVLGGSSGWHLAYQGSAEAIQRKIYSIADDFREPRFLDLASIEHCRQTGADVFGREHRCCEWCPDEDLPPYVLEHRERFAHMLLPEPVEAAA